MGSTWCVNSAPRLFALAEDGKAFVIPGGDASPEEIEEAVDSCPVGAVEEQQEGDL